MRNVLSKFVKLCFSLLPAGTPEFIYTALLSPRPLRFLTNKTLTFLAPPVFKINGVLVALNRRDPIFCGAVTLGVFEKFETEVIRQNLRPGGVVIDIGANVGYYTAIASKVVGSSGQVLAIEPDPENFSFLNKTIALNKFHNVKCFQIALSNISGRGKLFLSRDNLGDHRIYPSPEKREEIEVELLTLDDLLDREGVTKVDFIKMDIQGAEGLAIQGMKNTLERNRNLKLFTEFWPLGIERTGILPPDYLRNISGYGFKIFNINRKNGDLEQVTNIDLFAKKFRGREFANLFCES